MKQHQREKCLRAIKSILRRWDPIGVLDETDPNWETDNEYDSYAPGILKMLERGINELGIANHLLQLRSVSMGGGDELDLTQKDIEIAALLTSWRDSGYKQVANDQGNTRTF